ncbi:MAG: addiction module toxin RelE [Candidatus Diapherotrites archaeon CG09_land_8_20_14_0_10_32_12]|nr:MAG: addiction module toxin RelE [Candidatus Diapherotrites archaeon CG09_land_8_20_14_0_10_32_12]
MFDFDYSDELKTILKKVHKKDKIKHEEILKKIGEIINQTPETINHYKNLRHNLSDRKRVHIGKNFVLTFKVFLKENFILFVNFDHGDNIYK